MRCVHCFEVYDEGYAECPYCGFSPGSSAAEMYYLAPGTVLQGRYTIGQVMGSGGFGIIYKAWDNSNNMAVAVKEYYPGGMVNRIPGSAAIKLSAGNRAPEFEEGIARFVKEAVYTASFAGHPNIIKLLDRFDENNTVYYVMEYLKGSTLGKYQKASEKIDIGQAIDIITQVCGALKEVHRKGILHRDISPDNILVPPDYPESPVKLIDFGAARFEPNEKDNILTRIMKPGYSPPEQYELNRGQNEQIDIYALGATLYTLLTGLTPEEATNRKIIDELPSPASLNSEIPKHVNDAIERAMAVDPRLRFKTVQEFEDAIWQRIKVVTPAEDLSRRKKQRRRFLFSASAALIIGVAVLGIVFFGQLDKATLPDADIQMWYLKSGDSASDKAKEAVLEEVIELFELQYENVRVELIGYSEQEYAETVYEAIRRGGVPVVFESGMFSDDDLNKAVELGDVISKTELEECYFFERYTRYFPEKKQIPLGFNVSAVYINPLLCRYEADGVGDISGLMAEMPLEISGQGLSVKDAGSYDTAFGSSVDIVDGALFYSSATGAYFSDTSEYYSIQVNMPAQYKVLYVDSDVVPAEFTDLWSVLKGDSNENKASKRLLQFMLSKNQQYILHLQTRKHALPLNKQTLETYSTEVYRDYSGFFVNMDRYSFDSR